MANLPSDLRNKLERVVIDARDVAEVGARAALEALAVHHHEPYPHMKPAQRELRNHLRARARQLGDRRLLKPDAKGKDHEINHLVGECAYEHWHRMLFARFLAENNLLIEPQQNMAISLAEAEELAKEDGVDVWVFASRCAQRMLPQIFRPDDPLLQVSFATEHMLKLEKLLGSLPQPVFTASDALGWVYQFWQSKKKDEINRSEVKIGADEIAVVTQLFTEPYMVEFLLHNTLGAWWAGKKLAATDAATAKTEDELRKKITLPGVNWEYLRFVRSSPSKGEGRGEGDGSWRPAAGTFDGWPKTAAELKLLDPCNGSGHFLVAGLHHLVPIRMAEEGLWAAQAVDAVLRDNLHGLEIDERCCQIAAFALAFAAWTYPDAGGYRPLPDLHIACTGIGPQCSKEQWLRLAEEAAARGGMPAKRDLFRTEESLLSAPLRNTLGALYELFAQAAILGSLIDPSKLPKDLFHAGYHAVAPLLAAILKAERADDETRERAIAAAGMAKAAELLAGKYTLVITNVPYLTRHQHSQLLASFADAYYPTARADLATIFLDRAAKWLGQGCTLAAVSPQNWLHQYRYTAFRRDRLSRYTWHFVGWLGAGAFEAISGEVVKPILIAHSNGIPREQHVFTAIDVAGQPYAQKPELLSSGSLDYSSQTSQLHNPDARLMLADSKSDGLLLGNYAECYQGLRTGDASRFIRTAWELPGLGDDWIPFKTTSDLQEGIEAGHTHAIFWQKGKGQLATYAAETRDKLHDMHESGNRCWGRSGVAFGQITLRPTRYHGEHFDNTLAVIVPKVEADLGAILAFCASDEYVPLVRHLERGLYVTNASLIKVPFDRDRWCRIAEEIYPDGLPEPESDDPTQWLFHGRPEESTAPLQVAVARLLGYRWPAELDDKMRLSKRARALVKRSEELAKFADEDGIACIPSVRGEEPAAERLLALLAAAGIKPAKVRELAGGSDLENWLRNAFFEEHCKLFHDRPFVWHIWDGRKRDGFHALVNYHKLCEGKGKGRKLLESLTYSYLGEWITRQKDSMKRGEGGAEDRLAAAIELQKRLQAILEGEPPFDLFVRWKPLAGQPIGWEPDINDGVRMNIRPLLASDLPGGKKGAGVLRCKPNIKWTKDRGKEPERPKADYPWFWGWDEKTEDFLGGKTFDGNRWNDCHYTNKVKQAACEAAKKGGK